jgi:hypothetical protein
MLCFRFWFVLAKVNEADMGAAFELKLIIKIVLIHFLQSFEFHARLRISHEVDEPE